MKLVTISFWVNGNLANLKSDLFRWNCWKSICWYIIIGSFLRKKWKISSASKDREFFLNLFNNVNLVNVLTRTRFRWGRLFLFHYINIWTFSWCWWLLPSSEQIHCLTWKKTAWVTNKKLKNRQIIYRMKTCIFSEKAIVFEMVSSYEFFILIRKIMLANH